MLWRTGVSRLERRASRLPGVWWPSYNDAHLVMQAMITRTKTWSFCLSASYGFGKIGYMFYHGVSEHGGFTSSVWQFHPIWLPWVLQSLKVSPNKIHPDQEKIQIGRPRKWKSTKEHVDWVCWFWIAVSIWSLLKNWTCCRISFVSKTSHTRRWCRNGWATVTADSATAVSTCKPTCYLASFLPTQLLTGHSGASLSAAKHPARNFTSFCREHTLDI